MTYNPACAETLTLQAVFHKKKKKKDAFMRVARSGERHKDMAEQAGQVECIVLIVLPSSLNKVLKESPLSHKFSWEEKVCRNEG